MLLLAHAARAFLRAPSFSDRGCGKCAAAVKFASFLAGNIFQGDGDGGYSTLLGAVATPAPEGKRRRFYDDGGFDDLCTSFRRAMMTPPMAAKLAQSRRKSPVVVMTPRSPNIFAPSPSVQRAPAQAAEAA